MDRRLIRQLRPTVPSGVRFEDLGDRLVLRAKVDLTGVATGLFASPAVCVELEVASSGGVVDFVGFSFAQFAMPVRGGTGRPIDWSPASNVNSPPRVLKYRESGSEKSSDFEREPGVNYCMVYGAARCFCGRPARDSSLSLTPALPAPRGGDMNILT